MWDINITVKGSICIDSGCITLLGATPLPPL